MGLLEWSRGTWRMSFILQKEKVLNLEKRETCQKGQERVRIGRKGERGVFGSANNEDILGNGNNYETPRRDGEMRCMDLRGRSRTFGIAEAGSA